MARGKFIDRDSVFKAAELIEKDFETNKIAYFSNISEWTVNRIRKDMKVAKGELDYTEHSKEHNFSQNRYNYVLEYVRSKQKDVEEFMQKNNEDITNEDIKSMNAYVRQELNKLSVRLDELDNILDSINQRLEKVEERLDRRWFF